MSMISELTKKLRDKSSSTMFPPEFRGLLAQAADTIEELSEKCRTIDAEPVRYGKWMKSSVISWKCSECGEISFNKGKYCSNCGAKMNGKAMEADKNNG